MTHCARGGASSRRTGVVVLEHARKRRRPAPPGRLTRMREVTSGDSALTLLHMSTLAVYPGSFDPLTNGHVDIIARGARLFDRIIVAILVNAEKAPLFTMAERVEIARAVFKDAPERRSRHVRRPARGLRRAPARRNVIVRGLRAVSDFEFEFQMALMNRG